MASCVPRNRIFGVFKVPMTSFSRYPRGLKPLISYTSLPFHLSLLYYRSLNQLSHEYHSQFIQVHLGLLLRLVNLEVVYLYFWHHQYLVFHLDYSASCYPKYLYPLLYFLVGHIISFLSILFLLFLFLLLLFLTPS